MQPCGTYIWGQDRKPQNVQLLGLQGICGAPDCMGGVESRPICIHWCVDMFGCLCACFCCMCHSLSYNMGSEFGGGGGGEVTQVLCRNSNTTCALWGKYLQFFIVRICVNIYVRGWWWKQEVQGQLRLCPASADHISPIHPCHEDGVACMCDFLTFFCNENSTCGTSDMVDVSCPHCSSWSEGPLTNTQKTHAYIKPLERKMTNVSPLSFLWRDIVTGWTEANNFQTSLRQWQLFIPLLSLSTIKSHQKT